VLDFEGMTVLDGELAVPCNSQSAAVGLNSLPRQLFCLAGVRESGVEGVGPVQRASCEPRQDREVAAAAGMFLVLQDSLA